jgi:hypothetical protein
MGFVRETSWEVRLFIQDPSTSTFFASKEIWSSASRPCHGCLFAYVGSVYYGKSGISEVGEKFNTLLSNWNFSNVVAFTQPSKLADLPLTTVKAGDPFDCVGCPPLIQNRGPDSFQSYL